MSRAVVYQRGAESIEINATIGRTIFEQADQLGILHTIESRDYIFRSADLVIAGDITTPIAGDRIIETIGEAAVTYQVMSPGVAGPNDPPFRYSDPQREAIRCHTKAVPNA